MQINKPGLWVRIGVALGIGWLVVSFARVLGEDMTLKLKADLLAYSTIIAVAIMAAGLITQWFLDYVEAKREGRELE